MTERQRRALLRAAIARELIEEEMERVAGGHGAPQFLGGDVLI